MRVRVGGKFYYPLDVLRIQLVRLAVKINVAQDSVGDLVPAGVLRSIREVVQKLHVHAMDAGAGGEIELVGTDYLVKFPVFRVDAHVAVKILCPRQGLKRFYEFLLVRGKLRGHVAERFDIAHLHVPERRSGAAGGEDRQRTPSLDLELGIHSVEYLSSVDVHLDALAYRLHLELVPAVGHLRHHPGGYPLGDHVIYAVKIDPPPGGIQQDLQVILKVLVASQDHPRPARGIAVGAYPHGDDGVAFAEPVQRHEVGKRVDFLLRYLFPVIGQLPFPVIHCRRPVGEIAGSENLSCRQPLVENAALYDKIVERPRRSVSGQEPYRAFLCICLVLVVVIYKLHVVYRYLYGPVAGVYPEREPFVLHYRHLFLDQRGVFPGDAFLEFQEKALHAVFFLDHDNVRIAVVGSPELHSYLRVLGFLHQCLELYDAVPEDEVRRFQLAIPTLEAGVSNVLTAIADLQVRFRPGSRPVSR